MVQNDFFGLLLTLYLGIGLRVKIFVNCLVYFLLLQGNSWNEPSSIGFVIYSSTTSVKSWKNMTIIAEMKCFLLILLHCKTTDESITAAAKNLHVFPFDFATCYKWKSRQNSRNDQNGPQFWKDKHLTLCNIFCNLLHTHSGGLRPWRPIAAATILPNLLYRNTLNTINYDNFEKVFRLVYKLIRS